MKLQGNHMANYIALLRKDRRSDYGVEFPDFPGCISAGSTLDEARHMAEEALNAHIALMVEDGDPIPVPTPLDAIKVRKNVIPFAVEVKPETLKVVRVNITATGAALNAIDRAAARHGKTRSGFMVDAALVAAEQPAKKKRTAVA